LADYKAPFTLNVTQRQSTGEILGYELDQQLLPKEPLVYFATMERPILWTEAEPIYITQLVSAIGKEHEKLRPQCKQISAVFNEWKNKLFIGAQTGVTRQPNPQTALPTEGWKLVNVWTEPVGTPLPEDEMADAPVVTDMYDASVYLNGFVWHNDSPKTAEYRAAPEVAQMHYRKCAEIRVFSGLQMVIKPIHQFFLDARANGEDF
jgi:hypothetical protein